MQSLYDRLAYLEGKLSDRTESNISTEAISPNEPQDQWHVSATRPLALNSNLSPPRRLQIDKNSTYLELGEAQIYSKHTTPQTTRDDNEGGGNGYRCGDEGGVVNAMGMSQLTPNAKVDTSGELYGSPSATSLLFDIREQCNHRSLPRGFSQDVSPGTSLRAQPALLTLSSANEDDYHLPPRNIADSLLQLYRERVQNIYPFLHWPTFLDAYNRLWLSDLDAKRMPERAGVGLGSRDCPASVFYCALNAMFALASQFTKGTAQERKDKSASFVRRSRHLLRLDFLDGASMCMVQAFLIFARYLQTTNLPSRCWNVVGAAYRMAQGLELQHNMDDGQTSPLNIEIRRRVWHSCASLDTYDTPLP